MGISINTKRKKVIEKVYEVEDLLSPKAIWTERIKKINNFEIQSHPSICDTHITVSNNRLHYSQSYWERTSKFIDSSHLHELAEALSYFSRIDFVHGDLNTKNILCTRSGYRVIDFEPDLYQIKNRNKQWMVTVPYIALKDKERDQITSLTDKIGFAYFIQRLNKKIGPKEIVDAKQHYNHKKYLTLDEDQLDEMNFKDIVTILVK